MSTQPPKFIPLTDYIEYPVEEMKRRAHAFYADIKRRRTVRDFSSKDIANEVIIDCLKAAGTAPNGANRQPWHFVVVRNPEIKKKIRLAAEKEEVAFYTERAPAEWLEALAPLGTNEHKPFLESAPCLIVIFAQTHGVTKDGKKFKNYYCQESVGIASGMLITALHQAGLVTLTHTPSPMGFLRDMLNRPSHERAYLILVAGYPAKDAQVPNITKKPLSEIASFID